MCSRAFAALLMLTVIAPGRPISASVSPTNDDAFLGRWNITATRSQSGDPRICWLELRRDDGVLKGGFNAGGGAVFDLPQVKTTLFLRTSSPLKKQRSRNPHPSAGQGGICKAETIPVVRPALSGSPSAFGFPFPTSASDVIPFRTYAVAESTGMHGHKGELPFRPPLPDCACETPFYA